MKPDLLKQDPPPRWTLENPPRESLATSRPHRCWAIVLHAGRQTSINVSESGQSCAAVARSGPKSAPESVRFARLLSRLGICATLTRRTSAGLRERVRPTTSACTTSVRRPRRAKYRWRRSAPLPCASPINPRSRAAWDAGSSTSALPNVCLPAPAPSRSKPECCNRWSDSFLRRLWPRKTRHFQRECLQPFRCSFSLRPGSLAPRGAEAADRHLARLARGGARCCRAQRGRQHGLATRLPIDEKEEPEGEDNGERDRGQVHQLRRDKALVALWRRWTLPPPPKRNEKSVNALHP